MKQEAPAQAREQSDRAVSESEIAQRAYEIYQRRGGQDGSALDDWLQAEAELTEGPPVLYGFPPSEDALKRTG
jgi:hypothetical protein